MRKHRARMTGKTHNGWCNSKSGWSSRKFADAPRFIRSFTVEERECLQIIRHMITENKNYWHRIETFGPGEDKSITFFSSKSYAYRFGCTCPEVGSGTSFFINDCETTVPALRLDYQFLSVDRRSGAGIPSYAKKPYYERKVVHPELAYTPQKNRITERLIVFCRENLNCDCLVCLKLR